MSSPCYQIGFMSEYLMDLRRDGGFEEGVNIKRSAVRLPDLFRLQKWLERHGNVDGAVGLLVGFDQGYK
jgi:hypothetical protein